MKNFILVMTSLASFVAMGNYDEDSQELYCKTFQGLNVEVVVKKDTPKTLNIKSLSTYKPPVPVEAKIEESWKDYRKYKRQFVNYSDRIALRMTKEENFRKANEGGNILKAFGVLEGYDFKTIEVQCFYHENFR